MTLIEIFSGSPIENFISTLALKPQKTIFVAPDTKKVWREIPRYKKILSGRGIQCEMDAVRASRNDLDDICRVIEGILSDENENYVVDISGGDSVILTAVGMTLGRKNGRNLFAFRISPVSRRGILFRFGGEDGAEKFVFDFSYNTEVYLTCEENIILHGGVVCSRGIKFDADAPEVFDIESMWKLCKADPAGWNAKIGRLSSETSRYGESEIRTISKDIIGSSAKNSVDKKLWKALVACGFIIIDEEMSRRGSYFFRYKNKIVEECLNKSGTILEYRTYLAGIRAKHEEDRAFCSVETGITIGWDDENGGFNGTQNEIDCMLMCGVCPIFVSCKNGDIKTEELYKLGTVSEEFGSSYTKAVLLSTTFFDENTAAQNTRTTSPKSVLKLKRRALDMNIKLISKANSMGEGTFDSAVESLASF